MAILLVVLATGLEARGPCDLAACILDRLGVERSVCTPEKLAAIAAGVQLTCGRTTLDFPAFSDAIDDAMPNLGGDYPVRTGFRTRNTGRVLYGVLGEAAFAISYRRNKEVRIASGAFRSDCSRDGVVSPADDPSIFCPRPTRRVVPHFPSRAFALNRSGIVLLSVTVDEAGRVLDPCVLAVSKRELGFEEAAIRAVEQWSYRPGLRDGRPLAVRTTVRIDFPRRTGEELDQILSAMVREVLGADP